MITKLFAECKLRLKAALLFLFFLGILSARGQSEDCKLSIGTNLGGISDWMTEMPFVDMMHNARTWGTRNQTDWIEGDVNEWNTELAHRVEKDENGYPLEVPFFFDDAALEDSQIIFTVWAYLAAWPSGIYTCFYEGEGEIQFGADGEVIHAEPGKLTVNITPSSEGGFLEMKITRSKRGNHIRNIRLIMPGHENTYQDQPFNPLYLEKLQPFKALRFMDWGSTNNWGHDNMWECDDEPSDTILTPWDQRSRMAHYTWATNKGVPYEMMCDLCNTLGVDMWVCMPHCASDEYILQAATLIKDRLNPTLTIYAEYGNENWNWMFGQTQWLNTFFCENRGIPWPEGIVDKTQNHLDLWTNVFASQPERLVRVAGVQTAWQDVANRTIRNLRANSFDAVAVTGYFGLHETDDNLLDEMGAEATAADIARMIRQSMKTEIEWISSDYEELAVPLGKKIVYYEAGQHITPTPFGEEPTYAQALLDIQRDTALYNLYNEWFDLVGGLIPEGDKAVYMNFSFVGSLSARYGSWGILETLYQDTSMVYAPKYQAIAEYIQKCNNEVSNKFLQPAGSFPETLKIIKRGSKHFVILSEEPMHEVKIFSFTGQLLYAIQVPNKEYTDISLSRLTTGNYIVVVTAGKQPISRKIRID